MKRMNQMNAIRRRLARSDLVNERPAAGYFEASPLGNGDIGALVWGDGRPLIFSLDKADFWEMRGDDPSTRPEFNRANLEELVAEENLAELARVFENPRNAMGNPQGGRPYQTKLPVGQAKLFFTGRPRSCRSRLALASGLYSQEILFAGGAAASVQAFTCRRKNLLCIRVTTRGAARLEKFYSISSFHVAGCEQAGIHGETLIDADLTRILKQWGYADPVYGRDGDTAWWSARDFQDKSLVTAWRVVQKKARSAGPAARRRASGLRVVEIFVAIEYGPGPTAMSRARENLDWAQERGFAHLLRGTEEFWRDYWSRSVVSIPDARVGQLFDIESYKFACCTGPDRLPVFLKGVWNASDQFPQYGSDFHTDLMQMAYDHIYTANRVDFGMGLYKWFAGNMPRYEAFCERFFGVKGGAVAYCSTALDGRCIFDWWQIIFWVGGGPWLATYFWRHWLCTGDREFLRDQVYPILRKFATAYLGLLTGGPDGRLHLEHTMSPEYMKDDFSRVWIGQDSSMDLALVRCTLASLLEAQRELGIADDLAPRVRQATADLADYPAYNPLTHRHNTLEVGRGQPQTQSHRHHGHLAAIYPLGLLSPFDPAQRELVEGSLNHLVFRGMGVWDGWSYPWASCLYSRGCMPNAALRMLRFYAEEFIAPNTFHTNSTYQLKSGLDANAWRLMSLEGSFMYLAGVYEMLLQSYGGKIVILPGIPDDWKGRDIGFTGLLAEGGFVIDARATRGALACARIRSTRGGPCTVRQTFPDPWRLVDHRGRSVQVEVRDGWISWQTAERAEYLILVERAEYPILAGGPALKKAKALLANMPRQEACGNLFGVKA